jgi:periplasmic divalent cation tolerance protein
MDKIFFVYTTWPSPELAERAAREAVEEKLAACANVLPGSKSFFSWKEKFEVANEVVVIFKTSNRLELLLEEKIRTLHPYEVPCILGLEVTGGHEPFLAWVHGSVSP